MSDLIQRLNHLATLGGAWGEEGQTILEAADEIERLEERHTKFLKEFWSTNAENERLTRIEEKYTNLCDVLNEQTQGIQVLRNLLQKWIDADDWTIHLTSMAELDEETKAALEVNDE